MIQQPRSRDSLSGLQATRDPWNNARNRVTDPASFSQAKPDCFFRAPHNIGGGAVNFWTSRAEAYGDCDLPHSHRRIERPVVGNSALRVGRAERDRLEVCRWDAREVELRIGSESEAAVVLRLTQHYTARRSVFSKDT